MSRFTLKIGLGPVSLFANQIAKPTARHSMASGITNRDGIVTLSQTERNLPTTANVDARDFKDLACRFDRPNWANFT